MSAFGERRDQDIQKLKELQKQSGDRIRVTRVSGQPANEIDIELNVKTAPSKEYPTAVQNLTKLTVSLPARYPFDEPFVSIRTPILHPNVYTSGRICLGVKWIPSFGLDLLIRRVVQIVIFDPAILNEKSPANGEALAWYRQARQQNANSFPTDSFALSSADQSKKIRWGDIPTPVAKALVPCPSCQTKLSLSAGKMGLVRCPRCGTSFRTAT